MDDDNEIKETGVYCPDCGRPIMRLIEKTEQDDMGEYKEVQICDVCDTLCYIVRREGERHGPERRFEAYPRDHV